MLGFMPGIPLRWAARPFDRDGRNKSAMTPAVSLCRHAGGFDHLFRHFAVLDDLGGERVGRIGAANEAAILELLLRKIGLGDDRGDLLGEPIDDRPRRAGRHKPVSLSVGTCRKLGEWMLLSITNGVMVPALIWPMTLPSPNKPIGVKPDKMALTASPPPLNGTRTQSAPRSFLSVSM